METFNDCKKKRKNGTVCSKYDTREGKKKETVDYAERQPQSERRRVVTLYIIQLPYFIVSAVTRSICQHSSLFWKFFFSSRRCTRYCSIIFLSFILFHGNRDGKLKLKPSEILRDDSVTVDFYHKVKIPRIYQIIVGSMSLNSCSFCDSHVPFPIGWITSPWRIALQSLFQYVRVYWRIETWKQGQGNPVERLWSFHWEIRSTFVMFNEPIALGWLSTIYFHSEWQTVHWPTRARVCAHWTLFTAQSMCKEN